MKIEYQLNEADFISAHQFSALRRTPWRRIRLWFFILLGAVLIASALPLLFRPDSRLSGVFVLFSGLYCAFLSVISRYLAKRRFRKMTHLHGRYTMHVDDEGVRYIAPNGESAMDWNVWGSFGEESKSFVLVQRGSTMFMPIPKRQLVDSQIDELRSLFKTHLPLK